ncbi:MULTISPECIES: PHB depolymerase family esterase [unclassified Ruegeria]|uniref:alpha/beta hydrolase family esterase n=1 Tax=unclassified Ruegeria TaxID=2625375 RepID=UPI001492BA79|nr:MULTISPECIES: prolyl oligopeptidase family serine peptidase [unclassified Ruegeria]NOD34881.1 prolyl oligopeptidase family serine peptidase [Ruegeria sp. HKCCD7296]NOE42142.1 prolyl oligopeptidase family serine peptidase [Ruegeria sp. HKCCD7319]
MIYRLLCLLLLTASPAFAMGPSNTDCHGDTACEVGDRSYHVLEPEGWDGETPLPVLLHFHGWARQGTVVVNHERIAGATKLRGVLLVAPNGLGKSWNFWTSDTGDVPFADRVLEDVAKRYPIDPDRIYVSGYSFGGAMAWRYVCQSGNDIAALLAVAGSIRQTENCPEGPREARHVHGLSDTVMDFPYGANGDTTYPVSLWREKYNCNGATPRGDWSVVPILTLSRVEWTDCAQGQVVLDTHPGGHFIPHGWIGRQLDELLGRTPTYP